jgi:hypothetical protein
VISESSSPSASKTAKNLGYQFTQREEPKMAVAVQVDVPGGTEQRYEQIVATIFPEDELSEGWLLHLAGPTENGWRVLNVCNHESSSRHSLASNSSPPRNERGTQHQR